MCLENQIATERAQHQVAIQKHADTERRVVEEREKQIKELKEVMTSQFRNLATEILDEKTALFKKNEQECLAVSLKPFTDNFAV